ncbi:MAG: hypothetical protein Q8N47_18175, partial [Bryobacterales bacterium]|nr:hypothetical protein [Bryobacterales bacterium]
LRRRQPAPVTGAPPVRRPKTWSSRSGYVYQYVFEGHRQRAGETEYLFQVTSGREAPLAVRVVLPDDVIQEWERAHEVTLRSSERYGIAKMALFQAFDERASPARMRAAVRVRRADLEAIIETLGII